MAHYAFLDKNNIVTEVITGKDETETIEGLDPEIWYGNFRGQKCVRTSYHGNIRYNYAGIGFTYDPDLDAFLAPKPYPSWVLDKDKKWIAPIPEPINADNFYLWDEANTTWFLPPEKPDSSTAWYWDMESRQWLES